MTTVLAQLAVQRFYDNAGVVAVGGKLYTYQAGTTTPQATYTDSTGVTPNTNPIILNARGEAQIWLTPSLVYKFVLQDAAGNTLWTVDNITGIDTNAPLTTLAGSAGSSLIGFIQGGGGAVARTLQAKIRGDVMVSCADFSGDQTDGVTDSAASINAAITYVNSLGGGEVFIPGTRAFSTITPLSNVTLRGTPGLSVLKQIQPGSVTQTGIYHPSGGGALTNFEIRGITFDGQRQQNPTNVANDLIALYAGATDAISNIRVQDCFFQDAQNNFISCFVSQSGGTIDSVSVRRCRFITSVGKRFTSGTATKTSMDGLRTNQTFDTTYAGYGTTPITNVEVIDCYGESIRTLADFKRGTRGFMSRGNVTLNMYDVDHSVDGSFDGVIADNLCRFQSTYTGPYVHNDFVEVQGENIQIHGVVVDGGNLINNGIYLTDYGLGASEGGSGPSYRGHQCVDVHVSGCSVKNTSGHAFRVLNSSSCSIHDSYASAAGGRVCSVESGGTRLDSDGVTPLVTQSISIGRIRNSGCVSGVLIGSSALNSRYIPCPTNQGQDFYDIGGLSPPGGTGGGAATIQSAVNAPWVNEAYRELNVNPVLQMQDSGSASSVAPSFYSFANGCTQASTAPPNGVPWALALTDANGSAISSMTMNASLPAVQGQIFFSRIVAQYGNSAKWSMQIDELNSSGTVLASYYYGRTDMNLFGGGWIEYDVGHVVQNATCAKLVFRLNPAAAASTDTANTGTTNFANWRISHTAVGVF